VKIERREGTRIRLGFVIFL